MQENLKKGNSFETIGEDRDNVLDMFTERTKVEELLVRMGITLEDLKDVTSTMNSNDLKNLRKVVKILINKQQYENDIDELYNDAYLVSEKINYKQPSYEMFAKHNFMGSVKSVKQRKNSYEGKSDLDKINVGIICSDQFTISAALDGENLFYDSNDVSDGSDYTNDKFIVINGNFRPRSLEQQIRFIEDWN